MWRKEQVIGFLQINGDLNGDKKRTLWYEQAIGHETNERRPYTRHLHAPSGIVLRLILTLTYFPKTILNSPSLYKSFRLRHRYSGCGCGISRGGSPLDTTKTIPQNKLQKQRGANKRTRRAWTAFGLKDGEQRSNRLYGCFFFGWVRVLGTECTGVYWKGPGGEVKRNRRLCRISRSFCAVLFMSTRQ